MVSVTLNRPHEANALSPALADEFCDVISSSDGDPECRLVVIRGSGKFFCAGGDVVGMATADDQGGFLADLAGTLHQGILQLAGSRLVTIAVVQGPAAGAGLGLVLNADIVLASPKASFVSAYGAIGLTPDCGVSYLLPRVIGRRKATQMLLTQRVVGAQEALDWGLVTELVGEDELEARTREVAAELLRGSAHALAGTKRLLNAANLTDYSGHLRDEAATISRMITYPETRARVDAFLRRSEDRGKKVDREAEPQTAPSGPGASARAQNVRVQVAEGVNQ
ncbi:enoyl-CoA hydratase/isomerase family protein [Specibacter sp. RAF43]